MAKKGHHSPEVMTKKGRQFLEEKTGRYHQTQLPPRVTPTLVTPRHVVTPLVSRYNFMLFTVSHFVGYLGYFSTVSLSNCKTVFQFIL